MRYPVRIAVLVCVLVALLAPVIAYADGPCGGCGVCPAPCPAGNPCYGLSSTGPCPDDPELSAECNQEAPPYYVVVNRQVECLNRTGSGCQPFILKNPECTDCTSRECASIDVEAKVCKPLLTGKVPDGQTAVVYEMCCAGAAKGSWNFRIRLLDSKGNCPIDPENKEWVQGLPPGTGIDLPAPVIVGGLAFLGVGLLGTGVVVRRSRRSK